MQRSRVYYRRRNYVDAHQPERSRPREYRRSAISYIIQRVSHLCDSLLRSVCFRYDGAALICPLRFSARSISPCSTSTYLPPNLQHPFPVRLLQWHSRRLPSHRRSIRQMRKWRHHLLRRRRQLQRLQPHLRSQPKQCHNRNVRQPPPAPKRHLRPSLIQRHDIRLRLQQSLLVRLRWVRHPIHRHTERNNRVDRLVWTGVVGC